MKGQLTIEYMLTFILFIGLIIFIYSQYSSNIPTFISEISKEDSRSKTYQISELLLNDPGEPSDWDNDISSAERLGLSDETYNKSNLLSLDKITDLNSMCPSDYLGVQRLLALNQTFYIRFYNITSTGLRDILLDCSPPQALITKTELNATVRRITSFYNNTDGTINFGELIIEV